MPCGEMTLTLEDMAMITALSLEGATVTGMIQSESWQDMVEEYIGVRPPNPGAKKTSCVTSSWLRQHFNVCPADADDDIVERHARVCKDEERVRRTCQMMALKLNCVTGNPVNPARAPGGSSDSQPTPVHSAPGGSSAMARPSTSHRAGKAPASPQASDEDVPGDDLEDSPAPGFADQFIFSQHMDDAPPYT
ncbi:hypothetical protein HU200_033277 [Digitaria exilis]|uniref:Aminotransferase-like plant mobile domain-containing protein n=1 Tax=Digitaria exilis TaxID=1010633 RepID=A0A835BVJ7_9POAL|nr:hypothetical protein HU200_033277 [Digitaria exilis]